MVHLRIIERSALALVIALSFGCGADSPTDGGEEAPAIELSANDADFEGSVGGADPAAVTVEVTNAGGGTLSALSGSVAYAPGEPTGWLIATLSGTTAPADLTLEAATGALPSGSYDATVAVAAGGAGNSPQLVAVSFEVAPAPATVSLSAAEAEFDADQGMDDPDPQVIDVANGGGGTLTGLAAVVEHVVGGPPGWLEATLSGTTAPATLTLAATTGTLPPGTYQATVAVSASDATGGPPLVSVTLVVHEVVWTLGAETETALVEGSSPGVSALVPLRCPEDGVSTGYEGRVGTHFDELRVICAPLGGDGSLGAPASSGPLGASPGGQEFTAACPLDDGQPTVQVRGDGFRNGHIHNVRARCRTLAEVVAGAANSAAGSATALIGAGPYGDSEAYDVACPDGSVASGLYGTYATSGGLVVSIGHFCRTVLLQRLATPS